jgi:hypothetical protein
MTEDEMVWMCNVWERQEMHICSENLKERGHFEDSRLNKKVLVIVQ